MGNPTSATDWWYNEIKHYDYSKPMLTEMTQQFTQLIWKSTTKVAFGIAGAFVVGWYYPAGNVQGQFEENVLPLSERIKSELEKDIDNQLKKRTQRIQDQLAEKE